MTVENWWQPSRLPKRGANPEILKGRRLTSGKRGAVRLFATDAILPSIFERDAQSCPAAQALCELRSQTPSGPEGSSGKRTLDCAAVRLGRGASF